MKSQINEDRKSNHYRLSKKILAIAVAFIAICCSTSNAQTEFSKAALSEKLITLDGSSLAFGEILKNYEGKTVVIEVWASWCGDCIKAMPIIKDIQKNNPDVIYMFISMDRTQDKWKEGITKHDLTGNHFFAPDGMKGAFGQAINLDWIPRYIIVDKSGKIALYRAVETDAEKLKTTLKSLR